MAKKQTWFDIATEDELRDVHAALEAGEIPNPPFQGDWMEPAIRADAMDIIGNKIIARAVERRRREAGELASVPGPIVGAPRTGVRGFLERYGFVIGVGIGVAIIPILFIVTHFGGEDAPAPAPVATPVAERLPDRFADAVNPAECADWWDAYWAASRSGGAANVYYPRLGAHERQLRLACGSAWVDSNLP